MSVEASTSPPATGGNYRPALAVLSGVFFMWGFATVLNDILVPHLKAVFQLDYGQSLLIQFIFYLAYFVTSVPWAKLLERIGYKMSVVAGLGLQATGALLFVPAAQFATFPLFLAALFVLASGITLLQVAANPYVAVIGPASSASMRLNLVQAFNTMGDAVAPLFGGLLILSRSTTGTQDATSNVVISLEERLADARAVELPYLLVVAILLGLALLIWRFHLPDISAGNRRAASEERKHQSLWRHRNLVFGVPAIFIYMIAEIGIASTLVNYISLPEIGNMSHADAAKYLTFMWSGAMVGRFGGAFLMRRFRPEALLVVVSVAAFGLTVTSVATSGGIAMWTLIMLGLCHSIMFPTIFTLGIRGLGPLTEEGSGLLIMAISGGACAALQGVIADHVGLQLSLLLPAACYAYVLFYAVWGSRPVGGIEDRVLSQE